MTILATFVAAVPFAPLAWSASHGPITITCTRTVLVTFAVYRYMDTPASNGCWSYERVVQGNWHICHYNGAVNGTGPRWVYDDTSPLHDLSTETQLIQNCAAGRSSGYEFMARRNGSWRKLSPVPVTRFYAETYSSGSVANDYWDFWVANPSIGRPMVNVGPLTNAGARDLAEFVCRRVTSGTYIGVYAGSEVSHANGKLSAIENGLNACTA